MNQLLRQNQDQTTDLVSTSAEIPMLSDPKKIFRSTESILSELDLLLHLE